MTGKDFSGPAPVIKAPTPPQVEEATNKDASEYSGTPSTVKACKQSRVSGALSKEEIIGNVEDEQ
jgi:transcription factor TFIIIB component B''